MSSTGTTALLKFRKKPIIVEAVQWFSGKDVPGVVEDGRFPDFPASIETLEGWFGVSVGDWIITGVKGERYPCKPDIFEMTYELVKEKGE